MGRTAIEVDLPEGARILLDTTCLAAYLDDSEAAHPVARHVLDSLVASGRNPAIISMVTMMEILVRPLRQSPPGHQTVLRVVQHHPNLTAVDLDLQMAQEAASLRASHGFRPPDALVVGTGLARQVGYLVTNDAEWGRKLERIRGRIEVITLAKYLPFD